MRIQHNIAALNSYRNLSNNNTAVSKNLEKLSSGYKINRAGDDAAGLAISEKMRAQITGLETAQKNAQDGISLVQTAEGALTEVHSMLNRMVELANQSANGTYQDEVDRENLQKEINSLVDEIDRISKSTNFNGINLLDGTMGAGNTGTGTASDLITGQLKSDAVKTLTTGSTSDSAVYEIDFDGIAFGKDGTANVKFGNFNVDVEVTKDMTAEDFAKAVADAINKSELGTGSSASGAAAFSAVSDLKFTATAEGTKVKLTANKVGEDGTSGIDASTKVSVTDKAAAGEEIQAPDVAVDETNAMGLGSVAFEFAKDATDDIKKAFIEALGSDGFSIKFTSSDAKSDASTGKITIDTEALNLPKGYKLQYVDSKGATTDVPTNGEISVGTDADKAIDVSEEMQFKIVTDDGKEVGTIKVGALKGDLSAEKSSIITVAPPKTDGAGGAEKTRGVSALGETAASGIKEGDQFEMDFSKLETLPTEGQTIIIDGVTITLATQGDNSTVGNVKIGADIKETIDNIVAALNSDSSGGKALTDKYEISSKDGVITFKAKADDEEGEAPKVSGGTWTAANGITATKVEPEAPSEVKKGDKYEMDFSTLSNPKNNDKLVIGDIEVTFQNGKAVAALANGTSINVTIGKDINETMQNLADELNKTAGFKENWKVTADNGKLTFEAQKDGVSIPKVGSGTTWTGADKVTAKPVEDDSTATDAPQLGEGITLQIGDSSAEYNRITVTIGDMSAAALGIEGLDISTQAAAMASIDKIKAAINKVSSTRGDLGAIQNRLEHTINNLSVTTENMTAAESRIRDVDMAKEMMAYTKNNILVQSSQAMLAQANQIPQGVLQLLQ